MKLLIWTILLLIWSYILNPEIEKQLRESWEITSETKIIDFNTIMNYLIEFSKWEHFWIYLFLIFFWIIAFIFYLRK